MVRLFYTLQNDHFIKRGPKVPYKNNKTVLNKRGRNSEHS